MPAGNDSPTTPPEGPPDGPDSPRPPPGGDTPDDTPGDTSGGLPRRGQVRQQDPETTRPREPTLAEKRARRLAAEREREAELAEQAAEERRRKVRKRWLVGGGVAVGLAAVVAIGYAVAAPDQVTARCVDENNVVVDESNCDPSHAVSHGGGGFYPIFLGGGGRQYHYYYGGSGTPGTVATGGTTVAPKNATVSTPSGKTIQRGGFGVSKSGSSGS